MRQILKGLIAAVAVMAAAPAMACGYTPCGQPVYVAPVAAYTGCNPCGGWVRERLPDPEQQYYYVNQGPTYTVPAIWRRIGSIAKDRSPVMATATTVRITIARTAIITGTTRRVTTTASACCAATTDPVES